MATARCYEVQGRTVTLPAVVRDASSGSVMYLVDRAAAQQLIPDAFEAVEAAPGKTQLALVIVDYRDNDLGDYDEVGIIFFVRPAGQPEDEVGTFIYKLPVNQSFTRDAGCQIWGFPKTVEQIEFSYSEESEDSKEAQSRATCRLEMDGRHVFTLSVPRGGTGSTPDTNSLGYTIIEGIAHRYEFIRGGTGEQTVPGGEGVELRLGDHPIADELRGLGLPDTAPLLSAWTEHMTGSFGPSEKL